MKASLVRKIANSVINKATKERKNTLWKTCIKEIFASAEQGAFSAEFDQKDYSVRDLWVIQDMLEDYDKEYKTEFLPYSVPNSGCTCVEGENCRKCKKYILVVKF